MAVKKKILLFGFSALPEILAVAAAAERFGAETVPVCPGDRCGQTLERLAAEGDAPAPAPAAAPGGQDAGVLRAGAGIWIRCWRRCGRRASAA